MYISSLASLCIIPQVLEGQIQELAVQKTKIAEKTGELSGTLASKDAEIAALREENAELRAELDALRARIAMAGTKNNGQKAPARIGNGS